jgi:Co/Zn/Cd efflux system component
VDASLMPLRADAGEDRKPGEHRAIRWVLVINFTQFLAAGTVGLLASSAGLLGAALDNLGDTAVYGVSLYAASRGNAAKARAARLSGALLVLSGLGLVAEVLRRFVAGSDPVGPAMIATAMLNGATNLINLKLLKPHRDRGVHVEASWIFTTNDMIVNGGVVASGLLVMLFDSRIPDLIIGFVVAAVVLNGAREIFEQARAARR